MLSASECLCSPLSEQCYLPSVFISVIQSSLDRPQCYKRVQTSEHWTSKPTTVIYDRWRVWRGARERDAGTVYAVKSNDKHVPEQPWGCGT